MVWIPDWAWSALKGGGGKDNGKSKGKGKGKGKKGRRGPSKLDPTKTLWVGNIAEGLKYADLKAHCDQAGPCLWAEVYENKGKGTGALGYKTAEEAAAALPQLNGSLLNGKALEVDHWEKGSK